jgi:hypothetical protein
VSQVVTELSSRIQTYLSIDVKEGAKVGIYTITEEERQEMLDTFKETLVRYKFDWIALRTIMVATGAVISGSTALAVLLRGEFVPQDLDIYVNEKGLAGILTFLTNHRYQIVTPRPRYAFEKKYPGSKIILTLKRDDGEKIDVIGTTDHVLATITQFHSTVVMNYISSHGIVSLYPEWTMRKNGLVTKRNMPWRIIDKYRARGFKIAYTTAELAKYNANHDCGEHICCPKMKRYLRDGLSLFIPFDKAKDICMLEDIDETKLWWILREVGECSKAESH